MRVDSPAATTKVLAMAPATHGLLGRILSANEDASRRFGKNTAEVDAFIDAVAQLTPWQWRQVLTARRLLSTVPKEETAAPTHPFYAIPTPLPRTDPRPSD